MKLQYIFMISILLCSVAFSSQGTILKSLLRKKLSLIPNVGSSSASIQIGSTTQVGTVGTVGTVVPVGTVGTIGTVGTVGTVGIVETDATIGEIVPIVPAIETLQPDVINESELVEEFHPIPSQVSVYSSAPVYRTPVYYAAAAAVPKPVIRRTVYVETQRNNLGPLPGIIGNIPGLSGLSGLKSIIGNALISAASAPAAPASTINASGQFSYRP